MISDPKLPFTADTTGVPAEPVGPDSRSCSPASPFGGATVVAPHWRAPVCLFVRDDGSDVDDPALASGVV